MISQLNSMTMGNKLLLYGLVAQWDGAFHHSHCIHASIQLILSILCRRLLIL